MKTKLKYFLKLTTIFLVLFVIYLSLIQIWDISSSEYNPEGYLDHKTKTGPDQIEDWTSNRRLHD